MTDGHEREKVLIHLPPLTVSLAVDLVDGTTREPPKKMPSVTIDGIDAKPEPKSDRYLLFLDVELPEPPTQTVVFVDGGDQYRDATHRVFVTERGDLNVPPEVEVYRPTNPTIPVVLFPDDATVIRGYVQDEQDNRMTGAELRVPDFDLVTKTDANGRFVLYFAKEPSGGEVTVGLSHADLDGPKSVPLTVVANAETVYTLEVNTETGHVEVEEGIG